MEWTSALGIGIACAIGGYIAARNKKRDESPFIDLPPQPGRETRQPPRPLPQGRVEQSRDPKH